MMGDFAADLGCKVKYCNGYGEYDDSALQLALLEDINGIKFLLMANG